MNPQLKEKNGRYYQEVEVVMLATKSGSQISIRKSDNKLIYNKDYFNTDLANNQNLYFLSDDEIKEGDWFLFEDRVLQCTSRSGNGSSVWFGNSEYEAHKKYCKKIIATTDESLGLPRPSDSFIRKYIEEYNASRQITNVLVEYETYIHNPQTNEEWHSTNQLWAEDCEFKNRLKVDSNNNITTTKLKDSYSRAEVFEFLEFAMEKTDSFGNWGAEDLYHYIKKNL